MPSSKRKTASRRSKAPKARPIPSASAPPQPPRRRSQDENGLIGSDEQLDDAGDEDNGAEAVQAQAPAESAESPAQPQAPRPPKPLRPKPLRQSSKPSRPSRFRQLPSSRGHASAAARRDPGPVAVEPAATTPVAACCHAGRSARCRTRGDASCRTGSTSARSGRARGRRPAPHRRSAPVVAEQPIVIPPATPSAKAQALHDVVNAAGLQWVETDPDRHAQTQLRIAAAHTPARLGRERKAVPPVSNEPLVQVETRH